MTVECAGRDVVSQFKRDRTSRGTVSARRPPDVGERAGAAGGGDLIVALCPVVMPHPCFVSTPGRSHLTTHHSPPTLLTTPH